MTSYRFAALAGTLLALHAAAFSQADHLLISEVATNSPGTESNTVSGEYIEIFNPTGSPINLDNYYISDDPTYYNIVTTPSGFDMGAADTMLKFPAGTTIAPGGVIVVTQSASQFAADYFGGNLSAFFAQPGSPQLFEVVDTDAAAAQMTVLNTNTSGGNTTFSKTNGGEFVLMFYWDGSTDLVKDVDIVSWGTSTGPTGTAAFAPKTGLTVDGPDADTNATAYQADNGGLNLVVNASGASPSVITRISSAETDETATGGNGYTGHDESTENANATWSGSTDTTAANTPGVCPLSYVGGNAPPSIGAITRSVQHPSTTETVTISATLTDIEGTVASADLVLDSGSGFTTVSLTQVGATSEWSATVGPFATNDTFVKFYVVATDNNGKSASSPQSAPDAFHVLHVTDDPVDGNDVVINEILYDNPGSESYEFVEFLNTRDTAVRLDYSRLQDTSGASFTFPPNTEIPANGFLVATLDLAAFQTAYPSVTNVYDWGTFGLNNTGDTVSLFHPNGIGWNAPDVALDVVPYGIDAPWPTGVDGTGRTLELRNAALDNSLGESWLASPDATGTPGASNGAARTSARDWALFE